MKLGLVRRVHDELHLVRCSLEETQIPLGSRIVAPGLTAHPLRR